MPSASASHRRVEPSTSVNRNVTTPDGAGAADTLTGFHKHRVRACSISGSPWSWHRCGEEPFSPLIRQMPTGSQFDLDIVKVAQDDQRTHSVSLNVLNACVSNA